MQFNNKIIKEALEQKVTAQAMHVRMTVAACGFSEQVVMSQHCNFYWVRRYHAIPLRKSVLPLGLPRQERAGARFYFIMLNLPAFR